MTRVNKTDEILIARYVDGELSDADRAAFVARLERDADLQTAVQAAETQARTLREADPQPLRAPAGFSTSVLDSVRRMPSREELVQITNDEADVEALVSFGRRLLVAAVVLCVAGFLFGFKGWQGVGGDLSADPEDRKLMQELDTKVKEFRMEQQLSGRKKK